MSEQTKKHEELSDDQLSTVSGGTGNGVHNSRLEHLNNQTKSDGPIEDIQDTRLGELDTANN